MASAGRAVRWLAYALLSMPTVAAHGGGGLPVESRFEFPPWLLWAVGALVVAVSFAVVAGFLTRGLAPAAPRRLPAHRWTPPGPGAWLGLMVFGVLVVAAAIDSTASGAVVVLVWVAGWALLPMLAYSVGNPFERVNPLAHFARWIDQIRDASHWTRRAPMLGTWPATVALLAAVGAEASWPAVFRGPILAGVILLYVCATLLAMFVFGGRAWLDRSDLLTQMFRWWAAAAPRRADGRWGWPGTRLLTWDASGRGHVAFAVAILYSVNHDGFLASKPGAAAVAGLAAWVGPVAAWLVLAIGFLLFLGAYHGCVLGIRRFGPTLEAHHVVAARFAPALLPIAVGYHVAHNAFYVFENLGRIAAVVPSLLGAGTLAQQWSSWPAPLSPAGVAWLSSLQMLFILVGHVVAVGVAHRLAAQAFPSRVQAVRSGVPLTGAMVLFTLVGLWIVGQAGAGGPVA